MSETCPICLESILEHDNVLCMPVCMHKIHTSCELKAAQYDARCPVCRSKDPNLTSRQDDDAAMYSNLERLAHEHEQQVRRYNRKRSDMIKKHSKLKHIRDQLKTQKQSYISKEKELQKQWMKLQRECWNNDPEIAKLKEERKKYLRRTSFLCKKLEQEIEDKIGPRPDLYLNI